MSAPQRRGACPGLSAPMPTGDGLLVRLMPSAPIPLEAFAGLCAAARTHGNGTIEITARGSLQIRGLTPRSAPLFAAAVADLDIAAIEGVPVIADPLPDHPSTLVDAAAIASVVRKAIAAARLVLAPKVSIVIDGGGPLHLDALAADIRLRAVRAGLHVALGGDAASAMPLGSIALDNAAAVMVRLLEVIVRQGPTARVHDVLRDHGIAAFRTAADGDLSVAPDLPHRPPAEPICQHPLRDGTLALGLALAFGHAQADALCELARLAAAHGARTARPAHGRALLLIGLPNKSASHLADALAALGFITRADDPRLRIVACPGRPACASGLIAARALATEIAQHAIALHGLPENGTLHVSGCPKGCAHPAPAALTMVGTERGCGIVRHGTARMTPDRYIDPADLVSEITHMTACVHEAAHG
jgi:precorrin-3B synthase